MSDLEPRHDSPSKSGLHNILRPFSVLRNTTAKILAGVGLATLVATCYASPLIEANKNNTEQNSTREKLGFDMSFVLEIDKDDWQSTPGSLWPFTDLIIQQNGRATPDYFQKVLVASPSHPLQPMPDLLTGKVDELNARTNFGFAFDEEVYIFAQLDKSANVNSRGIALVKEDAQGKVESRAILAIYGNSVFMKFFDIKKDASKPYREMQIYQYTNQVDSEGLDFGLKITRNGQLSFITPDGDILGIELNKDFSFFKNQANLSYLHVGSFGENPDQVVATKITLLHPTKQ